MPLKYSEIIHPDYKSSLPEWDKWRLTYNGGRDFVDAYLETFSVREISDDFAKRKKITYCPAFAKQGVNEIKTSIYERMLDVSREGGSESYQEAIKGENGGVDLKGSSMNYFMGCLALPELLTMNKVGIYIDMPSNPGLNLNDSKATRPYIYFYRAEDIPCWVYDEGDNFNEFLGVLLREYIYKYDEDTGFPIGTDVRYRKLWMQDDRCHVAFYDDDGNMYDQYNKKITEPIVLELNRIPFRVMEISDSILRDVADYQIALLNLASSDLTYALKSNFPFYTEQFDWKADLPYMTDGVPSDTGTSAEAQVKTGKDVSVGTSQGRRYPVGSERPGFIHPSSEPLKASMEKQEQLKLEIRMLINLAISNLRGPKMASAETKEKDKEGLESGLSYIGLTLENTERFIAEIWADYEATNKIATINYPEDYSLKTENQRLEEADKLDKLSDSVPSITYKRSIAKRKTKILLGNKISKEDLEKINNEIDKAEVMNVDPEVLQTDVEAGLVSLEYASMLRGYPKGQVEQAKTDHEDRLARIAEAQSNPAARGVADGSGNPSKDAKDEKKQSKDTTQDDKVSDKTRGDGK